MSRRTVCVLHGMLALDEGLDPNRRVSHAMQHGFASRALLMPAEEQAAEARRLLDMSRKLLAEWEAPLSAVIVQ